MKTLYFEGAGSVPRGEVENCRIRTAFHNDEGQAIYLEITGMEVTKHTSKKYVSYKNVGFVDFCSYIQDEEVIHHQKHTTFEYTKTEILRYVNSLGCSFDNVVILPDLAGYRVFKDTDGYNYGDEFIHNAELTAGAEEIHAYFYQLEKFEGKQYPNFSLWVDSNKPELLHLLRHFPGYNRHWTIHNTENWQGTVTEEILGEYAC